LLQTHGVEWLGRLPGLEPVASDEGEGPVWLSAQGTRIMPTFRRGFVAFISCIIADWLAYGPAIVAAFSLSEKRPGVSGWVTLEGAGVVRLPRSHGGQEARYCPLEGIPPMPGSIPRPIFDLLGGKRYTNLDEWPGHEFAVIRGSKYYWREISRAALRWARTTLSQAP
jgi:hypothetical protein